MGGSTAFGSGCTVKARLHTAGGEAAEPSTHNGAPREGEGRRLQRGWEPGSRNGGSEREGQKTRQGKGRTHAGSLIGWRGRMKTEMEVVVHCDIHKMWTESGERRGSEDGYDRKQ